MTAAKRARATQLAREAAVAEAKAREEEAKKKAAEEEARKIQEEKLRLGVVWHAATQHAAFMSHAKRFDELTKEAEEVTIYGSVYRMLLVLE